MLPLRAPCLPRACGKEDIQYLVNITNEELAQLDYDLSIDWNNSGCRDKKGYTPTPGAVAIVSVCCLVLLLIATGSSIDWVMRYRKMIKKGRKQSTLCGERAK